MGELILCKENTAASPFYLEEGTLNVYSIEELCFYIENNVLFLNVDFMNPELMNWIEYGLRMPELAGELRTLVKENCTLDAFLERLLMGGGYCSAQEIKNVVLAARSIATKSREEMMKMRADRMLVKGSFLSAIYIYQRLLDEGKKEGLTDEARANVWHNLGCAHTRLFQFEEAAFCFENAFDINKKHESLRQLFFAAICTGSDDLVETYMIRHKVTLEEAKNFRWEVQNAMKDVSPRNILGDGKNGHYSEEIEELIKDWKRNYRLSCSM